MVHFFKPQQKEISTKHFALTITDLDIHGRGVAKNGNITWFVEGALPGEEVIVRTIDIKKNIGNAELISVKKRSVARVSPKCEYVPHCGGCSLQHMTPAMELTAKVQGVKRLFAKVLQLELPEPDQTLYGEEYQYRRICRLSVLGNRKEIHLGFREAYGKKLIEVEHCPVLEERLSKLIVPVRDMIVQLSNYKLVGHVELVAGDNTAMLLVRAINVMPAEDLQRIKEFAQQHNILGYVLTRHEKGSEELEQREELTCLNPEQTNNIKPYYTIEEQRISFLPNDFIQVNPAINKALVACALDYLNPQPEDEVLDLFCGLGNFTLPLAKRVKHVYGIEGVWDMVHEANANAQEAKLTNAEIFVHNLDDDFEKTIWAKSNLTKVLLDPGRQGAQRVMSYIAKRKIQQVVYVSCNPLTLVRDLAILLKEGYVVQKWSLFDMFPKTEHVETVVLLSREK